MHLCCHNLVVRIVPSAGGPGSDTASISDISETEEVEVPIVLESLAVPRLQKAQKVRELGHK